MKPRYSAGYLDRLFASEGYADLAQISSLLCATDRFSPNEHDYGLSAPLFVFVETLAWFAQSWRSGACTYYAATPWGRQDAMSRALESGADPALTGCYREGMRNWRDAEAMRAVDDWIEQHDEEVMSWLRTLVRVNRPSIEQLLS